jgi:gamma-glutamyltranspeptidase/glutathione hydrolase
MRPNDRPPFHRLWFRLVARPLISTVAESPLPSLRIPSRVACIALAACCAVALPPARAQEVAPERSTAWAAKAPVASRHWMIAAANPHAVDAGYGILARGGSAADAAVAVQLVLNLVEPQSSGIGGGAFMLYHDASRRRLVAYDGRETAPAAARPDRFLDREGRPLTHLDAVVGGRSVGVPGTVALLAEAHRRHGRLPWASLFAPAIELAERGFAVSPRLHALLAAQRHLTQPRARAYFHDADGRPLAVGAVLRNPAFAATLRRIAADGPDAFYRGDIARDIVATVAAAPVNAGDLTLADLAGYRVRMRAPVCGAYRAYTVCGMPPPSSGGITLLQLLRLLEPYDVAAMGPGSLWSAHFLSEAGRLAYADRDRYLADPDFVSIPTGLLDRAYLRERSRLIVPTRSIGRAGAGDPPTPAATRKVPYAAHAAPELPSTSHISIVDRDGNALAMTTTIEYAFGSGLMTEGGFLLNNELTDFSFVPAQGGKPVANRVEAGKRPRSSMAPTIVYDRAGRVVLIAGSAGGSAIINDVARTLVGVLDWGLDPQAAVALPAVGSRNGPTELEGTPGAMALEPKLRALGHETRVVEHASGLHAIARTPAGWAGGADPRREGTVRGQ